MPHRTWTVLGALTAGLCICASMPPWGWWPLAIVGIALWIHLLEGRRMRSRVAICWLVGVAWFGPSTLWMFQLTAPGYVLGVLFGWGAMVAVIGVVSPPDARRVIVLPAMVVLFEWFHMHAPFGGVPLSLLAYSQTRAPLLPVARLGGALLLSAAVAAVGAAAYLAAVRRPRPALVVVAVVAAVALGGARGRPGTRSLGNASPGCRAAVRRGPATPPPRRRSSTSATSPPHGRSTARSTWWSGPRTPSTSTGPSPTTPTVRNWPARPGGIGAPILVGVVESVDAEHFVNYVVVVNPDGSLTGRYDKERRVPFGEYVPLRNLLEPIAGSALPSRDQVPGVGTAMVPTSAGPMAVAISWEVFFGRRVREGVRAGGEVVLNPTNGSSYWLTQIQTQQVAASQLRAVESGRWLLQVAPTGFSAFVDPAGGIHQRTDISEEAVIERTVPRLDATTPAQALGDVPALVLALGSLAWFAVDERRRRRAGSPDDPGHASHRYI